MGSISLTPYNTRKDGMTIGGVLAVGLMLGGSLGTLDYPSIVASVSQPANAVQTPQSSSSNGEETSTPAKTIPPAPVHKKRARKKTRSSSQKVVVKNGSTSDPTVQFSTAGSQAQAAHQRRDTDVLLTNTNNNLQKLAGHPLNPSQEDMKTQINSYIGQAKAAEVSGDLQSAYNLALKANLLSKELVSK